MLSKLFPCQIEAAYGITCDEDPYVQLPAGDRNAPLSITNGQAPELDSVPADAALDGPIQLPKLPGRACTPVVFERYGRRVNRCGESLRDFALRTGASQRDAFHAWQKARVFVTSSGALPELWAC